MEMADAMIRRTKNAILELRINNVFLEGKRLDQATTKTDAILLKKQIDQNRRDCAEMGAHLEFLDRFKKTGGLASLDKPEAAEEKAE